VEYDRVPSPPERDRPFEPYEFEPGERPPERFGESPPRPYDPPLLDPDERASPLREPDLPP
jgi:hypothetical protein